MPPSNPLLRALPTSPVAAANARRAIETAKQEQKDRIKVSMFRQRFRNTALTNRAGTQLVGADAFLNHPADFH